MLIYPLTLLSVPYVQAFTIYMKTEQTLEIAQKLYEKKLITYPRTGSRYIPEAVIIPHCQRNATVLSELDGI